MADRVETQILIPLESTGRWSGDGRDI